MFKLNFDFLICTLLSSQPFVIRGRHHLLNKQPYIAFKKNENTFFRRLNAFSKHFIYNNIVSQLQIVRYEINVNVCFALDFFFKSIKKVSQNMSLIFPTSISNV